MQYRLEDILQNSGKKLQQRRFPVRLSNPPQQTQYSLNNNQQFEVFRDIQYRDEDSESVQTELLQAQFVSNFQDDIESQITKCEEIIGEEEKEPISEENLNLEEDIHRYSVIEENKENLQILANSDSDCMLESSDKENNLTPWKKSGQKYLKFGTGSGSISKFQTPIEESQVQEGGVIVSKKGTGSKRKPLKDITPSSKKDGQCRPRKLQFSQTFDSLKEGNGVVGAKVKMIR